MKTKLEILEETVKYYAEDLSRRGYDDVEDECRYFITKNKMCAIGRVAKNPREFEKRFKGESVASIRESLDQFLKPEYRGHSINFWDELQMLHDTDENWCEEGLSDRGKEVVEEIKLEVC